MLKRLLNFILLSNGITPSDEGERVDKWSRFREEREAWELERDLERAAPAAPEEARSQKPE